MEKPTKYYYKIVVEPLVHENGMWYDSGMYRWIKEKPVHIKQSTDKQNWYDVGVEVDTGTRDIDGPDTVFVITYYETGEQAKKWIESQLKEYNYLLKRYEEWVADTDNRKKREEAEKREEARKLKKHLKDNFDGMVFE